jgi:hypothetical protein
MWTCDHSKEAWAKLLKFRQEIKKKLGCLFIMATSINLVFKYGDFWRFSWIFAHFPPKKPFVQFVKDFLLPYCENLPNKITLIGTHYWLSSTIIGHFEAFHNAIGWSHVG